MPELILPADERRPPPLWRNLSFQLMWSSTAAAGFGDRMIELVALPMLGVAGEGAQAAPITAAVYFWFFLPWLVITPIGGWLADTLPRKWIMLGCDEARALLLGVAFLLVPAGLMQGAIPRGSDWQVFAILAGVGTCAAVFSPTRNAMIPQIVEAPQLNSANSMILGIGVIASLIGYVIGGWLLKSYPVRQGILVALLCYAVTGLFWIYVRPRPHTGLETDRQLGEWTRMKQAIRYIRRHRVVLRLVALNALLWSMAMVVAPAIAALCKQRYGIEEDFMWWFAVMSAMLGAGMLLAALFVTWVNLRRESDVLILAVIALTAVCLVALALNRSYGVGLFLAGAIGFSGGIVLIVISSLTQLVTPNFILGRVGGVREVLSNIVAVLVNLVVWQLPELRRVDARVPAADSLLIVSLYPLAAVLLGVASYGCWTRLCAGPLPSRMANFIWRLDRAAVLVWHRLVWIGRENVPSTGPVILAANHTAGLDPFLMQAAVPRLVRWVMLDSYRLRIANVLWKAIKPITIKQGAGDLPKLRQVLRALGEGEVVGLFPEGGIQRQKRELQPFEPGIAMLAVRSGAVIVPVWVEGTPMARHMFWHFARPSRSKVIFGKAYKPDPNLEYGGIADDLRRRMLDLASAA
jgi:1-acyl-sn-glycerol-3-phosphate acyltransferase